MWTVNRIQALVLGFFAVVLAILVGVLTLAPDVYDAALQLPADVRLAEIGVWGPRPGGVDNRRPAS